MALYLNQYADADAFSAATAIEGRSPLYKANTVGLITGGGESSLMYNKGAQYEIGDVLTFDNTLEKFEAYSLEKYLSLKDNLSPIGICVIPSSHAKVWGDGKARFIGKQIWKDIELYTYLEAFIHTDMFCSTLPRMSAPEYEEYSAFIGSDYYSENPDTKYESGLYYGYLADDDYQKIIPICDNTVFNSETAERLFGKGINRDNPYQVNNAFYPMDGRKNCEELAKISENLVVGDFFINALYGIWVNFNATMSECVPTSHQKYFENAFYIPTIGELSYLITNIKKIDEIYAAVFPDSFPLIETLLGSIIKTSSVQVYYADYYKSFEATSYALDFSNNYCGTRSMRANQASDGGEDCSVVPYIKFGGSTAVINPFL